MTLFEFIEVLSLCHINLFSYTKQVHGTESNNEQTQNQNYLLWLLCSGSRKSEIWLLNRKGESNQPASCCNKDDIAKFLRLIVPVDIHERVVRVSFVTVEFFLARCTWEAKLTKLSWQTLIDGVVRDVIFHHFAFLWVGTRHGWWRLAMFSNCGTLISRQ